MQSFIKLRWDVVFSAAVTVEVELTKKLEQEKKEFIENHMKLTTGMWWWKRNVTLEEATRAYECNMAYFGGCDRVYINRAKDLQILAIKASEEYAVDNDYVYLSIEDSNLLFHRKP